MTVVLPEALITASFISFHAAYKVTLCKNVVCDLLQPRKYKFILKAGDGQSLSSSLCVDPEWFGAVAVERVSQVTDSRATPLTTMKWKGDLLQSGFIIAELEIDFPQSCVV